MSLSATERRVRENTTALYSATLVDETETAVPSSSLTTLTLTLYDKATGTIINSREDQNVLNANNVTVSSAGVLTWTMQPEDNIIVTAASFSPSQYERHIALFEWTWSSGTKAGKYEVNIDVEQLTEVP